MRSQEGIILQLFISFLRIGAFTFGGGYAMLTVLEDEVVHHRNWISHEEMLDFYAIAQTTPGVIMVNVATFIGFKQAGLLGGILSTAAVITPSLIIVSVLTIFLQSFADNELLQKALTGINITVAAMLCSALIRLWKQSVKSVPMGILVVISFLLVQIWNISALIIIPFAAIFGIVQMRVNRK